MCLKESCFPDCGEVSFMVLYLRMFRKNIWLKATTLLIFEKLVNNRLVDHLEEYASFMIFSMVLGLPDQLQIF